MEIFTRKEYSGNLEFQKNLTSKKYVLWKLWEKVFLEYVLRSLLYFYIKLVLMLIQPKEKLS